MKVAVSGWRGNPERAAVMIQKHASEDMSISFIGVLKPFTKGYDIILNFGSHPLKILFLLTCRGKKVIRICGTDWYDSYNRRGWWIGKRLHRFLLKQTRLNIMYASEELKKDVGLRGEVYVNPVDENHFYPRSVPRCKEVCYYVNSGKLTYQPELMPDGATLIDGTVPYEDMPILLSSHRRYVRNTTHDAAPKLPYEALLCGCEVWVNGEKLDTVPEYMLTSYQGPRWIRYIQKLI